MGKSSEQYNSIAILLHWVMAIAFFLMLGSGIVMEYVEIEQNLKFQLFQWHKSLGLILLVAFVLRLLWRFASKVPPLPDKFEKWEKIAAKAGHWGLYALMLFMPLSGWIMVSSSVYGLPTFIFGLFEWPHIPGLEGNEEINGLSRDAHFYLAIIFGLFIFAHIGAVVKHYIFDKENLLTRMWWSSKQD